MPEIPIPQVDKTILTQFGLPTAVLLMVLGPLFGAYVWLVQSQIKEAHADRVRIEAQLGTRIDKLGDDLDFLSRTVDLSCAPSKRAQPSP